MLTSSAILTIVAISYLIGSIPFGVLLARTFKLPDPRTIGSGNIGATNMLRMGNKKVALLTLLLDVGKGVAAVMLTYYLFHDFSMSFWAALFAVLGHCYSPWLKFKGGKGVATAFGAMIAINTLVPMGMGALACPALVTTVWIIVLYATRYVALASIVSAIFFPIVTFFMFGMLYAPLLLALVIVMRHHTNIARLWRGEEPKLERTA